MEEKNAFKKRASAKGQLTLMINGIEDIIQNEGTVNRVNKWVQDARRRW